MNEISINIYKYGLDHKYWSDYDEYFRRSKEDKEMVANIMSEEVIGMHPIADVMLRISELEDFIEKKRKEYKS